MKRVISALIVLFAVTFVGARTEGVNDAAMEARDYVVLVSIDGFRWDYLDRYPTPVLSRLAAEGMRAERMIPVFPTLTFPNHYSIATGLYPASHGLVGNRFPNQARTRMFSLRDPEAVQDGAWYRGNPLWVAAERHGMVAASFFFVGSEADVRGVRPTYWRTYDGSIPGANRVEQVLKWLAMPEAARPHLVTLYFDDVDVAGHEFGPDSLAARQAIERVDGYLDALVRGIEELAHGGDVHVIVVSDHGLASYRRDARPFILDRVVQLDGVIVVDHGSAAFLFLDDQNADHAQALAVRINERWQHGRAYAAADAPAAWRVDPRGGFPDVIVQADPGHAVFSTQDKARHLSGGDHGWAPEYQAMHGIFLGWGGSLPRGHKLGPIRAVDVYPLIMALLELPIEEPIDGDPSVWPAELMYR